MSPPTGVPSPGSQWHAVTPQTRPLSITILELTPTSVTLALTRSPPSLPTLGSTHLTPHQHIAHTSHSHSHHASSGHLHASSSVNGKNKKKKKRRGSNAVPQGAESDEAADDGDYDSGPGGLVPGAYHFATMLPDGQTFKDMLSHGVVVTLDGMPWSRIVAHVSDDDDDDASGTPTLDDDDAEWEDEWEPAGRDEFSAEEGLANASGSGTGGTARRRRVRKNGGESAKAARRPSKNLHDKPDRPQRWDRERAVVVVYDLDPSQEHEIELQIVGLAGEVKDSLVPVSNAVLIPPASPSNSTLHPRSRANSLRSRSRPRSRSNSVNAPQPGPSPLGLETPSSPGRSSTPIPDQHVAIPTSILSPHDAQTAQTRHAIATALAERELLQVQIKEARKTAQRSEASLRTEIESLKKSSEKAGSNDQRNKQKYLALEQQVKQGWAGSETATQEAEDVKKAMPEVEARLAAMSKEVDSVRAEWQEYKAREEEARELDKKNRAEEDKKLADINSKIEKVTARKERKEAERAELQKKLEELELQRDEVERKTEENKALRRQGYFPGSTRYEAGGSGEFDGPGFGRGSAHPSMSNLATGNSNFNTGPPFRPRGGFGRFPSGGRPPPAQASPTVSQTFFPTPGSPAWNAPKPTSAAGSGSSSRAASGTNPSAAPFMPGHFSPPPGSGDPALHTALMPPQLQHRIYLPNSVRPRPTPNFHPPPSVLAEQAANAPSPSGSPAMSHAAPPAKMAGFQPAPAFPPLPTTTPARPSSNAQSGPSLASIVTRAVLAPTSELARGGIGSPPPGATGPGAIGPPSGVHGVVGQGRSPAVAAVRKGSDSFPPLSPSALGFGSPAARTTPPRTSSGSGSPWAAGGGQGSGSGSGAE